MTGFFAGAAVVVFVTTGVGFAAGAGIGAFTAVAVGATVDLIAALLTPVLFTAGAGVTFTNLPLTILCCTGVAPGRAAWYVVVVTGRPFTMRVCVTGTMPGCVATAP